MAKKRVLIVDDEKSSREMALFDLRNDYDCEMAVDAFDAYEKVCSAIIQKKPFDVVVLDEVMPDIYGTALLKIIRISEKYIPSHIGNRVKFVIVSSVESQDHLKNLYKKVMDDQCVYIKKPFDQSKLLETVKNVLA